MLRKLFVFVVCLVAAVATASAQTPPDNEIWYTTTDGKKLNGDFSNMVSNSYNNGRGVLKFQNCITNIRGSAFAGCSSLKSITIPNSETHIGYCAFEGCTSLNSVKVSNKNWYDYFKNFGVSDITFIVSTPQKYEEAQKLGATKLAIDSNSKYASNDGLCLIDNGKLILFIGKDLTECTIPESVTSIGERAFKGCSSLKSFKGKFASEDGRCLIKDGELIAFAPAGLTSYTIPNSVTSIGRYTFSDCSSITSITIPNSVTSIGEWAFKYCRSLTSITIPNSVTKIGGWAFYGCSSLTSITIPESVTSIGESAFSSCI